MKLEIEIPDEVLRATMADSAMDSLMSNRGYYNERLSEKIAKLVSERTHAAFEQLDLADMINAEVHRYAKATLEEEVRKIVAKMARDAVKAEMAKQDKLL